MKALLCTRLGGPDDLEIGNVADPVAGPDEAIVRVEAAALNFFDTLIISGKYQTKPTLPFSPAAEFAGTVESVGAAVSAVAPGDRVAGYIGYGAARERVVAPASQLVKLPPGLDADRAAGLIVTYGTSYYALKDRARLAPGETLVVLGASGGVGLAAVELGKLLGARVIACASSADKLEFARRHGADEVVNYAAENLRDALKAVGGERGVDVVYDPVGGAHAEAALRSLGWGGRFLVVGFAAGEIPKVPLNLVLLKSCDVRGIYWGAWVAREPHSHRANTADLLEWCAEGKLSAHVQATYPLEDAATALRALSDRSVMGKLVLKPTLSRSSRAHGA
jgi:NADPH2:quinone reductase